MFLTGLAAGEWPEPANGLFADEAQFAVMAQWLIEQDLGALAYHYCHQIGGNRQLAQPFLPSYWASASTSTMQLALLEQLWRELEQRHIPAVVLKGMALCLTIYPDAAVRPMSDIDFWIQPHHITAVWQMMAALGYVSQAEWTSPEAIPAHITQLLFYPVDPAQTKLGVEFHWDLISRTVLVGQLPLTRWWGRRQTRSWRGYEVCLLDPAAAFIHLCVHQMLQHRGELRLPWLVDIDQLLRGNDSYRLTAADWERVGAESRASGVLPAIQAAVRLTQSWLGTPLPPPVVSLLHEEADTAQVALFQTIAVPGGSPVTRLRADVAGVTGWRARLSLWRTMLLPHPSYMMRHYGVAHWSLLPFYYLSRLARGFIIEGRSRWQRWSGQRRKPRG